MSSETCSEDDDSCRIDIELYVIHPTLRPEDISQALRLDAHFAKTVGEPRTTPSGKPLSGTYADTQWRHMVQHAAQDRHFADQLADFVESLRSRSDALAMLRASGGQTRLMFVFLADLYHGDEISHETLSKIVELGLSLGIDCFAGSPG